MYAQQFFDVVDKINEIRVEIDSDLLSTLLLISLPSDFENFRCAIEAHDSLPFLDILCVKITKEADARKGREQHIECNVCKKKLSKAEEETEECSRKFQQRHFQVQVP